LSEKTAAVRVLLPYHLRNLAHIDGAVTLPVGAPVTQRTVFDALEGRYPALRGTIRDRPAVRLRAGPVARLAGRPAARRGGRGPGALAGGRGDVRRLTGCANLGSVAPPVRSTFP
jgi:hypothetical protein